MSQVFRRFYHTAKTGKVRYWGICVVGDEVRTEFGELGGKIQSGIDKGLVKNAGRSNEVSAVQDANEKAERLILDKQRDGYVELETPPLVGALAAGSGEIDLAVPLPTNLCFFKPDNEIDPGVAERIEAGDFWFTRKRDGEMMVLVHPTDPECPLIYSRTMLSSHHRETIPWEVRFPHLVEHLKRLPAGTLLLGEVVQNGSDDGRWTHVAKVLKAKTDKAIAAQKEFGALHFIVWDIAYFGEESLRDVPYRDRMDILDGLLDHLAYDDVSGTHGDIYFHRPETFTALEIMDMYADLQNEGLIGQSPFGRFHNDGTLRAIACEVALANGWEGWVAVDPDATFSEAFWNFRGKAERPVCSTKIKPYFEDDFVAYWHPDGAIDGFQRGSVGAGSRLGKVGSVSLYQVSSAGDLIYICDCGGGLDKDMVARLSDPSQYPICVQVEYETRQYVSLGGTSNALQFPRILRIRTDKAVEECINDRL